MPAPAFPLRSRPSPLCARISAAPIPKSLSATPAAPSGTSSSATKSTTTSSAGGSSARAGISASRAFSWRPAASSNTGPFAAPIAGSSPTAASPRPGSNSAIRSCTFWPGGAGAGTARRAAERRAVPAPAPPGQKVQLRIAELEPGLGEAAVGLEPAIGAANGPVLLDAAGRHEKARLAEIPARADDPPAEDVVVDFVAELDVPEGAAGVADKDFGIGAAEILAHKGEGRLRSGNAGAGIAQIERGHVSRVMP